MKCLNCGTKVNGNFCPKCGQKALTRRFQVREIINNILTSLISGDHKLWSTCASLLTKPGHMIREYLLGKRVSYFGPIPLLIRLVALYAIASYFFTDAVSPFDVVKLRMDSNSFNSSSADVFLSFYQFVLGNNVYFAFYSVLLSIIPYRIVFRKQMLARPTNELLPLNIAEHFVALTYQTAFNIILAFLLIPFSFLGEAHTWLARICFVMPTAYCFILYKQLLNISWVKSIWLNIQSVALSIIFNLAIILFTIGILYGLDNVVGA